MYFKYVVVMIDMVFFIDVEVNMKDMLQVNDEDCVVVCIDEWLDCYKYNLKGMIIMVLGKVGSSDIEMKIILVNNGFDLEFL